MNSKSRITVLAAALAAGTAFIAQAQTQSAIEFYDPTGATVTSKFGWLGSAADGYFFIETPNDGDGFKLQKGSLTLGGIITATKFVGDGSGLTGLNLPAELDPTVPAGLKDGISWNEIQDIPAGFADGIDNVATGGTGNPGESASAQEVAAALKQDAAFLASVKGSAGTGATAAEVAAALKQDAAFVTQVKGKDGTSPAPADVADVLKQDADFVTQVKGEQGEPGSNNWDDIKGKPAIPAINHTHEGYAASGHSHSEYAKLSGAVFTGSVEFNGGGVTMNTPAFAYENLVVWGLLEVNGGCDGCTNESSDKRFKKNIETIDSPLQKVQRINGVSFEWKSEKFPDKRFSEKRQIGVIAQDIEEVVPEVVTKDKDGYYLVDYSKLVPLLVEAIKEQQNQIKSAKIEVALLKEKYENQERMIEKILNELNAGKSDGENKKISLK